MADRLFNVLFLCTHNSARSVMAEALLNTIGAGRFHAFSAGSGAPKMDIIITGCDDAAGEVFPVWPGHPATAHWGFPDPSRVEGDDTAKRAAFDQVFHAIRRRIDLLVNLPLEKLERLALAAELKRIHAQ